MGTLEEELDELALGSKRLTVAFNRLQQKFGALLIVGIDSDKITFHLGRTENGTMFTLYDNGVILEQPGQNETKLSDWLSKLADGRYARNDAGEMVLVISPEK